MSSSLLYRVFSGIRARFLHADRIYSRNGIVVSTPIMSALGDLDASRAPFGWSGGYTLLTDGNVTITGSAAAEDTTLMDFATVFFVGASATAGTIVGSSISFLPLTSLGVGATNWKITYGMDRITTNTAAGITELSLRLVDNTTNLLPINFTNSALSWDGLSTDSKGKVCGLFIDSSQYALDPQQRYRIELVMTGINAGETWSANRFYVILELVDRPFFNV